MGKETQLSKQEQYKKTQLKAQKRFKQIANDYKKWGKSISLKDLMDFMDTESESLMRVAKNKSMIVDGKAVPIDDGMVLSLLYKSAGIDIIRQYLKSKLNS